MTSEQAYYDALKKIASDYQTSTQLRRNSERQYGLPFEEVIEMAYDNIQGIAKAAIKGKRRPK